MKKKQVSSLITEEPSLFVFILSLFCLPGFPLWGKQVIYLFQLFRKKMSFHFTFFIKCEERKYFRIENIFILSKQNVSVKLFWGNNVLLAEHLRMRYP